MQKGVICGFNSSNFTTFFHLLLPSVLTEFVKMSIAINFMLYTNIDVCTIMYNCIEGNRHNSINSFKCSTNTVWVKYWVISHYDRNLQHNVTILQNKQILVRFF